ncbi:MAG: hypothetical protein C5B52_14345 [Bacteroidetes bacterium]|nr:MAG: hypothetical protein C5B52_14345 [Bacteroidota bacterium]
MNYFEITRYSWLVLMIYWLLTAFQNKKTIKSQTGLSRIIYLTLMLVGFWLVYNRINWTGWLSLQILPHTYWDGLLGLTINLIGICFALLARIWLGKNWSGAVTIKKDHELIRSGPYSITRHPIYTGILFGMVGSVIALGEIRGLIALVLVFISLISKIKAEERFLNEIFPQYPSYCSTTQRLIPFIY